MTTTQNLLELVPEQFKPLYPLEEKLLEAATLGQEASDFESDKPIDMTQIGEAQTVRSELLIWLLTNPEVREAIHYKGLNIRGARVDGILDLQDSTIERPLRLCNCLVEEELILDSGKFILLDFSGSHTKTISAESIKVQHNVYLKDEFKANGEINLLGANIEGSLVCDGGEFNNPYGVALKGDGLITKGSVLLRNGFKAKGEVRLYGASIGSNLDCEDGEFVNPNSDNAALNCDGLTTQGAVLLRNGFKAKGEVRLRLAKIWSLLDCEGGVFENPHGEVALNCDGISTRGPTLIRYGFNTKGTVRLYGASIGMDLDCTDGRFESHDGEAITVANATIGGSVLMRRIYSSGLVNLFSTNISNNLDCEGGVFENPHGEVALNCDGMTAQGAVLLRNKFEANGAVRMYGASIGSDLDCTAAKFNTDSGVSFLGNVMNVKGAFIWRKLSNEVKGSIELVYAKVGIYVDDIQSWPSTGKFHIDGFSYGPFPSDVPADFKSRMEWLNLRPPDDTSVQPYEQLISVFRQMGLEDDARDIAIAKQKFVRKQLKGLSRLWSWILDITISYGYRPEKVIILFILPIIILGYFVFNWAHSIGVMEFIGNEAITNPTFNPFVYSLDVFLPIVNLHQESAWSPIPTAEYGKFVQSFIYIQILTGWFFTTLAVAAVTGLVRRD